MSEALAARQGLAGMLGTQAGRGSQGFPGDSSRKGDPVLLGMQVPSRRKSQSSETKVFAHVGIYFYTKKPGLDICALRSTVITLRHLHIT